LTTAKDYFDRLILINMRLVASGPTEEVFNVETLQKTYGGRLTILSDVANAVQKAEKLDRPESSSLAGLDVSESSPRL